MKIKDKLKIRLDMINSQIEIYKKKRNRGNTKRANYTSYT